MTTPYVFNESTQRLRLDSNCILAYCYSDGFSDRNLQGILILYNDFTCVIEIKASGKMYKEEHDRIPYNMETVILSLLEFSFKSFKEHYDYKSVIVDSIGGSMLLVNDNNETFTTRIMANLNDLHFKTAGDLALKDVVLGVNSIFESLFTLHLKAKL